MGIQEQGDKDRLGWAGGQGQGDGFGSQGQSDGAGGQGQGGLGVREQSNDSGAQRAGWWGWGSRGTVTGLGIEGKAGRVGWE